MHNQNIKEEVVKITKSLSLEDANDLFYKIILQKKLERAEDDIKMEEHTLQIRQKKN